MKKLFVLMILMGLLIGSAVLVLAQNRNNEEYKCTDSDGGKDYYVKGSIPMNCPGTTTTCGIDSDYCKEGSKTLVEYYCVDDTSYESEEYICPNSCENGACVEKEEEEEAEEEAEEDRETNITRTRVRGNKTTFRPWQKRTEEQCPESCSCQGAVVSCPTETGKIMTIEAGRSGNIITITVGKTNVSTELELEQEIVEDEATGKNRTRLRAKLSNGRKGEIKVMPDTASKKALERLRLKVCSAENNCTIELKEVGKGNETRLAYEVQAERHFRILGLFRTKARVKAQVDAETGEIIRVKKPWWAFLATEPEE